MTITHEPTEADQYFYAGGKRFPLVRDERVFAVRFRTGERSDSGRLSAASRQLLRDDARAVATLPGYGLTVFEAPIDDAPGRSGSDPATLEQVRADLRRRIDALADEDPVDFAAPAFRSAPGDRNPIFATRDFLVQFRPGVDQDRIDALNAEHEVVVVDTLGYADNGFRLRAPTADGPRGAVALAARYYESGLTVFATPDLIRRRQVRSTTELVPPAAPEAAAATGSTSVRTTRSGGGQFLSQQWHLWQSKAVDAWAVSKGSAEIAVAILDDGIDIDHVELAGKVIAQRDFENHVDDGRPKTAGDSHGTACAGVAVAKGVKASGSAPDCSLIAVRTPAFVGAADEATMFEWVADQGADVISCSWGPPDGEGSVDPLPDATRAAIQYCIQSGRGGLGIPIFWAGGNGDESISDDGYASNPDVIAVGACTDDEERSWYSDVGPELDICAPSSGDRNVGQKAIFTTDRSGADGYNSGNAAQGDPTGDYTNDFGGTSSATPLAAGIAGLMLSVNPDLRWHEVKEILEQTAVKIGDPGLYDANGHSNEFGFGRVDALAAVQEAQRRQGGGGGGGGSQPGLARPLITTLPDVAASGPPPTFTIDTIGRPYFAVEVATESRLLDATNTPLRTPASFWPDWNAAPPLAQATSTPTSFTLPADAWSRLRDAPQLFYRVHVASDPSWGDYAVSVDDVDHASAPSCTILQNGGGGGGGGGGGVPSGQRSVTYPSGATFQEVTHPTDGVDYSDPVANGMVPLIPIGGRAEEHLSSYFKLKELAAKKVGSQQLAAHARIDPELVDRLQRLRVHLGKGVNIEYGYRYPAYNSSVSGDADSQHLAGRAADIRVTGTSPADLAAHAVVAMGADIGLGLGSRTLHVDVRGTLTTWTYPGAEMDDAEFDAFVRARANRSVRGGRNAVVRREVEVWSDPRVTGPDAVARDGEPPAFTVWVGRNRFVGVEVATDWRLFDPDRFDLARTTGNFAMTWDAALSDAGDNLEIVCRLDPAAWRQLEKGDRTYYRAVTSPSADTIGAESMLTTPDERAEEVPSIDVVADLTLRRRPGQRPLDLVDAIEDAGKTDEQSWKVRR